jgi:hypothetical protein
MNNQWLFVIPRVEYFTVLCPQEATTLKLYNEGKLTLKNCCKGYSSYVTLYSTSMITINVTSDYEPSAPINLDDCFENTKNVRFENLPLHTPLVNVMSSIDNLKFASMKAEKIQQLIREQRVKHEQKLYNFMTSQWSILGTVSLFLLVICICCCCKCCRSFIFWLWSKWNLHDCWQQTKDKCHININYNCPEVSSPTYPLKSSLKLRCNYKC